MPTTEGHDAYPRAIRETLGAAVLHPTSRDKHNRIAQDHRGVKQRYYPTRGGGTFEEQRQYFRPVARSGEAVALADRRRVFRERWAAVIAELAAA